MPKQQYIVYNEYLNDFVFYEGENQHNRLEFKLDNLSPINVFGRVKNKIDKKRKTDLIVKGFEDDFINYLKREYKGTKVNIIKE